MEWGDPSQNVLRDQFNITGRTQYVLVGADDEVITRWFGPLTFDVVSMAIQEYLDNT